MEKDSNTNISLVNGIIMVIRIRESLNSYFTAGNRHIMPYVIYI